MATDRTGPPEEAPHVVRAELVLEGGGLRTLPLDELARLEAAKDQETLENVVLEYSDGRRLRPYRFGSVGPVEFDGETLVL